MSKIYLEYVLFEIQCSLIRSRLRSVNILLMFWTQVLLTRYKALTSESEISDSLKNLNLEKIVLWENLIDVLRPNYTLGPLEAMDLSSITWAVDKLLRRRQSFKGSTLLEWVYHLQHYDPYRAWVSPSHDHPLYFNFKNPLVFTVPI